MVEGSNETPPILNHKEYDEPSVFVPENLLREARRQNAVPHGDVPKICVLDPDGDIVRNLIASKKAASCPYWACYHTQLYSFAYDRIEFGIVGCAVGSAFAVLVAEQLFASGCELLISVTSSGQIAPEHDPPFFVLIERALRDVGTSYHYLAPTEYAHINEGLLEKLDGAFAGLTVPLYRGSTWTTDAPFRETSTSIAYARAEGIMAVEMETAALYALSQVRRRPVVCFAHVTNRMGSVAGDFEKGEAAGSQDALKVIALTARAWLSGRAE